MLTSIIDLLSFLTLGVLIIPGLIDFFTRAFEDF